MLVDENNELEYFSEIVNSEIRDKVDLRYYSVIIPYSTSGFNRALIISLKKNFGEVRKELKFNYGLKYFDAEIEEKKVLNLDGKIFTIWLVSV